MVKSVNATFSLENLHHGNNTTVSGHRYARIFYQTRMHSSRMCTARLLPVSPSMHCSGVYLVWGGTPGPRGDVPGPGWGVYLVWEVYLFWGVYLVWRVYLVRGMYLVRGRGCTWSGGYLPRYYPFPPWTDTYKNITFASFVCGR